LEILARDKLFSFLQTLVNYDRKEFYRIGPEARTKVSPLSLPLFENVKSFERKFKKIVKLKALFVEKLLKIL
jgi:hypothetical protein